MSSRSLRFSERALHDIRDVLQFTYDEWGEAQQIECAEAINRAIQRLLSFPHVGRVRSGIHGDLRSFPVERHIILYRVTPRELTILRLFHMHQDLDQLDFD